MLPVATCCFAHSCNHGYHQIVCACIHHITGTLLAPFASPPLLPFSRLRRPASCLLLHSRIAVFIALVWTSLWALQQLKALRFSFPKCKIPACRPTRCVNPSPLHPIAFPSTSFHCNGPGTAMKSTQVGMQAILGTCSPNKPPPFLTLLACRHGNERVTISSGRRAACPRRRPGPAAAAAAAAAATSRPRASKLLRTRTSRVLPGLVREQALPSAGGHRQGQLRSGVRGNRHNDRRARGHQEDTRRVRQRSRCHPDPARDQAAAPSETPRYAFRVVRVSLCSQNFELASRNRQPM